MSGFVLVSVDLGATSEQPALPANSVLAVTALQDNPRDACGILLQEQNDRLGQMYRVRLADTRPALLTTTLSPLDDPLTARQRTIVAKMAIKHEAGEGLLQLVPGDIIVDVVPNVSRGFDYGVTMNGAAGHFPAGSAVDVVLVEKLVHVATVQVTPGL